jgi:thymidylate kinase
MYDVVMSLSEEFEWTEVQELRLFKLCAALIPKPDLIFIIQVPPDVAYMRKKEELQSLNTAKEKFRFFQRLNPLLGTLSPGKIITVDNTKDLELVKTEILMTTLDFLRGG